MRIVESKRSGQEFLHDRGLQVVFRTVKQQANLAEQLLVRGEGNGSETFSLGHPCGVMVYHPKEKKFYQLIACWSKERNIFVRG